MRRLRALFLLLALVAVTLALGAAPAAATFHLMQVREVYPGSATTHESEYVELQMWTSGQNHVEGHVLRSYDSSGAVTGTFPFAHDVTGEANQSTLLLATPQAEAKFGVVADAPLTPGALSPTGGAVCWESIDCMAWGSFSGVLPSPAGSPAAPAGIPDGMALDRTIARGCATLLDPVDDTDNSAADFSTVFPLPRPNSVAPSERPCSGSAPGGGTDGGGGVGGGGGSASAPGENHAPETVLRRKPPRRTHDPTASFRFTASEPGGSFECKLDRRPYRRCRSPFTTRPLPLGKHLFLVRAHSDGGTNPTPAACRFRLLAKP